VLQNVIEAALSAELAEAVAKARTFAEASKAKNTRKAYASDLRDFRTYCARLKVSPLPADAAVVGTYLATMAQTKTVATIRRRIVAIAQDHKAAGLRNPVAVSTVQAVLGGIIRTKSVAPTKKTALTIDRLEETVKWLGTGLKGVIPTFVVRRKNRQEYGVKVFDDKGVAIHIDPKPCIDAREGIGEASAGARAGRPLSLEKFGLVRKRRRRHEGGRQYGRARYRKCSIGSAWSENPARAHVPCSGTGISLGRPLRSVARTGKAMSRSR